MAKILVADDNSNIQKMVGLALKDQGIDVVAVGNGEAAVRKISDVKPDLVLADVFMPVRNGYEVCQYVKTDSSLAHIPVILLVGAFDPLDEQEAQRVGADGVLKKPFVPPDPLISMVKSALARAGVSLTGAPVEPAPKPLAAADLLKNPNATPHTLPSVSPIPVPSSISLPALVSEPAAEEFSTRPAPVRIDAGKSPLAFSNMLGTAAPSETEEDLGFIPAVHPELATERDWRSSDEEETEEEAEEAPKASWRRDGADEEFAAAQTPSAVRDWRETVAQDAGAGKQHAAAWTPTVEKTKIADMEEEEEGISAKVTDSILSEARATTHAAPFSGDAWTAAVSAGTEEKIPAIRAEETTEKVLGEIPAYVAESAAVEAGPVEAAPAEVVQGQVAEQKSTEIPVPAPAATEHVQAAKAEANPTNSWFSSSSTPWEAEAEKASRLASTWDTPVSPATTQVVPTISEAIEETIVTPEATVAAAAAAEPVVAESLISHAAVEIEPLNGNNGTSAYAAESVIEEEPVREPISLPAATVEAIREEAAYVAEVSHQNVPSAAASEEASSKAPEPNMDDLVAKVMARMSPEALQAMTREILKPVVEAMVREELNAKK